MSPRRLLSEQGAFGEAVRRIMAADSFAELMAAGLPDRLGRRPAPDAAVGQAGHAYRIWAKLVHPDAAPDKETATRAFARLAALYAAREERTRLGSYRVGAAVAEGDIAVLFDGGDVLVKAPRLPVDNDLMAAEAAALRTLHERGDPRFRPYAPRLVESFRHDGREINVVERQIGCVSLAQLDGQLDLADSAWIWRRLLVALGWAHRAGVVHGAVLAEHVLINPEQRGLVLVDWCYSGERPRAVVKAAKAHYPPEVFRRRSATPATDIYMATGLMARMMGPRMPRSVRRFIDGCRFEAPRMRPQDAWALLEELDSLLHTLYEPHSFRPFNL